MVNTGDAKLDSHWRKAQAEFGPSAHVCEYGYGWKIERYVDGQTKRYYGVTFNEAMHNARNDLDF